LSYVNLNGELTNWDTMQRTGDAALRYGYGLFETILVKNSVIMLWEQHCVRLFRGMEQLGIAKPTHFTPGWLEKQVVEITIKNNINNVCRVRLQVSAGNGSLYEREQKLPQLMIECWPVDPLVLSLNTQGLHTGIATGLAKSPDNIANIKSCSALIYALAARQAMVNGWDDIFVKNTHGRIIESSIANIFLIKEAKVFTPPLSEGCIAGVMREYIIDSLAGHGMEVTEKELTEQDLYDADELFLSNAIRQVKWVGSLNNKRYNNSTVKHIYNLLFDNIHSY